VLFKSFMRLSAVDPGFRPEGVLAVRIQRQDNQAQFAADVLERAAALPGVLAAGAVSNLPMTGLEWGQNLTVTDRPFRGEQDYIWACHRVASRDYFHVIGMRLMKGRSFSAADTRDGPRVAVVNEAFARKAWPGQDTVGKQFRIGDFPKYAGSPVTVIGVVADAKFLGLGDETFPEMFFSMDQGGATSGMTFVLRAPQDPQSLAAAIRRVIRGVDPDQPVTRIETLETLVAESAAPQHVTTLLGGIFGLLAVVLAGTGLYGTVSYSVSQRTHDIGVRMALGAPQGSVVWLVVAQALELALVGLAVGLVTTITLGRVLGGLLFQVSPHDPLILIGVSVAFVIIALAASYAPAKRAAETDPLSALRCQ
jgi:putative ABC transport system permease protein